MGVILYFAFGLLNIGLLYLFTNLHLCKTGVDLFPGRVNDDKVETILCLLSYIISGPLGTVIVLMFGVILLMIWIKYYRKK